MASSDLSLNKFCKYSNLAHSTVKVRDWTHRYVTYGTTTSNVELVGIEVNVKINH